MPDSDKKAERNPRAAAFQRRERARRDKENKEREKRDGMTDKEYEETMSRNKKNLLL